MSSSPQLTLLEVQVESYAGHRPSNLFPQSLLELFQVRSKLIVLLLHQCQIILLVQLEL